MLSKKLPPELRNLQIAQHPIFLMGLTIAAISLAANIGYWTRGLSGQSFWINFFFAAMVEIIFVFLIWLGANIWKSGGRALATALILLSLAPWLASSVSNFMFLATLKEPQLASNQSAMDTAQETVLTADLARYARELSQYSDVVRKDVAALEERRAFCDRAPREECSSSDLADEIAINKKINELEASQATALSDLQTLTENRSAAITASEFSLALLAAKFDGNWLSREFLMVAFLDILKAVLFLVGLWINLRLYKAEEVTHEENVDLLGQLDDRLKAIQAMETSIDQKVAAAAAKEAERKKKRAAQKSAPVSTEPVSTEPVSKAPAKTPVKAKPAPSISGTGASNVIEYNHRQADGSTVRRKKSIA